MERESVCVCEADARANQASSSSRREGAGSGAPGLVSAVGRRTWPAGPKGFRRCRRSSTEGGEVWATRSGSRLVQPRAVMESRKEAEAMGAGVLRVRTAEDFVQTRR